MAVESMQKDKLGGEIRSHMSTTEEKRTTRVHVTMPETLARRLDELQQQVHAATTAELFRNALVVYSALAEAHKQGRKIILRSSDGKEEVQLALFV